MRAFARSAAKRQHTRGTRPRTVKSFTDMAACYCSHSPALRARWCLAPCRTRLCAAEPLPLSKNVSDGDIASLVRSWMTGFAELNCSLFAGGSSHHSRWQAALSATMGNKKKGKKAQGTQGAAAGMRGTPACTGDARGLTSRRGGFRTGRCASRGRCGAGEACSGGDGGQCTWWSGARGHCGRYHHARQPVRCCWCGLTRG